jgi:HEPN domain-containing protein
VDRKDLQALSRVRLREAKALLDAGLCDGAYYLAGYAVECALKACIAKATKRHEFPDKARVLGSYTHDLPELLRRADLERARIERERLDSEFGRNWSIVKIVV